MGWLISAVIILSFLPPEGVYGQEKKGGGPKHVFAGTPPAHPFNVILARPTDKSVTISVMASKDMMAQIAYGTVSGKLDKKTEDRQLKKGQPVEFFLNGLEPRAC
jgi:hypothetical protein